MRQCLHFIANGEALGPVLRALRQAHLNGHLIARSDRVYHPGGNTQIGWLAQREGRYEITPEGMAELTDR
jgi:hypothetical protein